jgi:hypothetical protein
MANVTWIGNAHGVKQIMTFTMGGTWLTGETLTWTISDKDIVVTLGANVTTANVATAFKEAYMSSTRLDGTGSTDATSNAGAQEFGEFREAIATVSGSVVTVIGKDAGHPIELTAAETSTSGTITAATPQAATGPNHWDNVDNWDTGSAPASDDVVILKDSKVHIWYGLPNGTMECTVNHYMTSSSEVGLPEVNARDPAYPYYEYRQRYVRFDDAGGSSNVLHRFGIGLGPGSRLMNFRHTGVKCSPVIFNTGQPNPNLLGTKALNICCSVNTSTINILNGSVNFGSQDATSSAFASATQTGGDSVCLTGLHTTAGVEVLGGRMLIGQTGVLANCQIRNGTLRLQNQTGTITTLGLYETGVAEYASTATITNLNCFGGTFDAREDVGAFTPTNATLYPGARYLDPYRRTTSPTAFLLLDDINQNVVLGGGFGNSIQLAL